MKAWPVLAISIVQSFLCLAHWFMYRTWIDFWWPMSPTAVHALRVAFIVLSFVFMTATLLGFRSSNPVVRIFYKAAALWMGLAQFPLRRHGNCVARGPVVALFRSSANKNRRQAVHRRSASQPQS